MNYMELVTLVLTQGISHRLGTEQLVLLLCRLQDWGEPRSLLRNTGNSRFPDISCAIYVAEQLGGEEMVQCKSQIKSVWAQTYTN